jgi:hypothetical protein
MLHKFYRWIVVAPWYSQVEEATTPTRGQPTLSPIGKGVSMHVIVEIEWRSLKAVSTTSNPGPTFVMSTKLK